MENAAHIAYNEIQKAVRVRKAVLWRMRSHKKQQEVSQAIARVETWISGHTKPSIDSLRKFLSDLGHELAVVIIGSKTGRAQHKKIITLITSQQ